MALVRTNDSTGQDVTVPTVEALIALRGEVAHHRPARRAQSIKTGPALSPIRGRGMEYAESREYVAGDDARHIDWRLTARTGRAHTKLFQAETERITAVLIDLSPSLFFGTRTRFKSVQAARVAASALWSAVRDGDRVGLVVPERTAASPRFASGVRGVLPLFHRLAQAYAAPRPRVQAALANPLSALAKRLRHGARLVIVADAHSVAEVPDTLWSMLQGIEVHVVLIVDALEQQPPARTLPARVGASRVFLRLGQSETATRWRDYFTTPIEAFKVTAMRQRLRIHLVSTDDNATEWLHGFNAPQAHVA